MTDLVLLLVLLFLGTIVLLYLVGELLVWALDHDLRRNWHERREARRRNRARPWR